MRIRRGHFSRRVWALVRRRALFGVQGFEQAIDAKTDARSRRDTQDHYLEADSARLSQDGRRVARRGRAQRAALELRRVGPIRQPHATVLQVMTSSAEERRFTYLEYLELEKGSEQHHEFVDGYVYAMLGGSPDHSRLASNVIGLLSAQLAGKP